MSGVAWFVDGAYVSRCWSAVSSKKIDWNRFRESVEDDAKAHIDVAYYFDGVEDLTAAQHNPFYNFLQLPLPNGPAFRFVAGSTQTRELDWPARMGGGHVVHPQSGEPYVQKMQKEVDVLLAFNLVRSQLKFGWKRLYLVAGDKDFFEVVRHLVENEGVDANVFGARRNQQGLPSISGKYGPFASHIYFEDLIDRISAEDGNA